MKTNLDLLFAMVEMSTGPLVLQEFKQHVLPKMGKLAPIAYEEISDEQYEAGLVQMKKELPAFIRKVLATPGELPPDFFLSSRN